MQIFISQTGFNVEGGWVWNNAVQVAGFKDGVAGAKNTYGLLLLLMWGYGCNYELCKKAQELIKYFIVYPKVSLIYAFDAIIVIFFWHKTVFP